MLASNRDLLPTAAGVIFSLGGIFLTWIWYRSTAKTQDYVRHWWESLQYIEAAIPLEPQFNFARHLEAKGRNEYRKFPKLIPILFVGAWIFLFLVAFGRSVLIVKCSLLR